MMNPVHAIGVFHDQKGSMRRSVAVSDTTMIATPRIAEATGDTGICVSRPSS